MKRDGDGARRLLLIPFAPGIGDVVMMEPLLRAVCAHLPSLRVTMTAMEYGGDILQPGNYDLASPSYFVAEPPARLRHLDRLIPRRVIAWAAEPAMTLDLGPFERVINLFWVWESRVPFDRWWTPQWPERVEVPHALDLLFSHLEGELGVPIPPEARVPRLQPFPDAEEWADRYVAEKLGVDPPPFVSLVVSSANRLKWWSVSGWAGLNRRLAARGIQRLLIAPQNQKHAARVYAECDPKPLWPSVGLRQMAALLHRSQAVVGIDTGPLHMAAGLGKPWVGLFGATNPDLIGPYDRSRGVALLARFPKEETCRECWLAFKNRKDRCATLPTTGCTAMITLDEVDEALELTRKGMSFACAGEGSPRKGL